MRTILKWLANGVEHRPLAVLLLLALISIPAILGGLGISLSERGRVGWRTAADPSQLVEANDAFGFEGWPVVLLLQADDVLSPKSLIAARDAIDALERLDAVFSTIWLGTVETVTLEGRTPLVPRTTDLKELLAVRSKIEEHPLVRGQLVSADAKSMLVGILPGVGYGDDGAELIRKTVERHLDPAGISFGVSGFFPLQSAQNQTMDNQHLRIMGTACLLVVGLAFALFRSFSAILIAVSGPGVAFLWTQGWLMFLGEPRNELVNLILPVMVIVIGFTDSVHLVVHLRESRSRGLSQRQAAGDAVRLIGFACLMTSLTTAIGFGSLMTTSADIILGFGRASVIGVALTFLAVILTVPLVSLTRLGRPIHKGQDRDWVAKGVQRASFILGPVIRHSKVVTTLSVVLLIAMVVYSLKLRPDDRLGYRMPHKSDAYQALLECDRTMGGILFLQVVVEWEEGASNPEIWERLAAIESKLNAEATIGTALSIRQWLSVLPGPQSPAKLSIVQLLPEDMRRRFWRGDERKTLVVARIRDLGIAHYEDVLKRLQTQFESLIDDSGGRVFATGRFVVTGRTVRRVVSELMASLLLASAVILAVMSIGYRSIHIGILSLIPNLIPLAATAALRAFFDDGLDIASACAFTVCLGLAVDDTIHFLSRYANERQNGKNMDEALSTTFLTVGHALVVTTLVMLAGFVSVMTSELQTHRLFAVTAAVTVASALIADLLFLPALLATFLGGTEETKGSVR